MTEQDLIDKMLFSSNVLFHKFSLLSSKHKDSVIYCFFEGENDSSYYISRINAYTDKPVEPIVCKGKSFVIDVKSRLDQEVYDKYLKLYFIDMDYDSKIEDDEIYTTPVYSIENFYCSLLFFQNVLKNEFQISSEQQEFDNLIEYFNDLQHKYHDCIILFNAWYYWFKNILKGNKKELKVNLDDKLPDKFMNMDFSVKSIDKIYTIETIEAHFSKVPKSDPQDIERIITKFSESDLSKVLRGKYEIYFIKNFLRFLIYEANEVSESFIINKRTKFNFGDDRFISQLAQYADTPNCLKVYLRNHLT